MKNRLGTAIDLGEPQSLCSDRDSMGRATRKSDLDVNDLDANDLEVNDLDHKEDRLP